MVLFPQQKKQRYSCYSELYFTGPLSSKSEEEKILPHLFDQEQPIIAAPSDELIEQNLDKRKSYQYHVQEWNSLAHMTGAVERMVRSVKRALRSLEVQVFKSDALHTALVEIESSLNSRPDNLRALTPNDLLLLKPNTSIPLHSDEKEINARNVYQQSLAASKVF
ncbi:hypothetical protein AC249_AIPGENE28331 [Exaiptasia diaphana]|nr:hypothetical protein AC249_AIPGENE28331 [Exaiptasia diaphana]